MLVLVVLPNRIISPFGRVYFLTVTFPADSSVADAVKLTAVEVPFLIYI